MRPFLLFASLGVLAMFAMTIDSLPMARAVTGSMNAPVTEITIEPDAPLSIVKITKATRRVFTVEVVNVSDKPVRGFQCLLSKKCPTGTIPEGGGLSFRPEKVLGPGKNIVFDVGEEREVIESKIQKCIDSAKDITLQLTNVEFVNGKE